jgi:hypothetical protein
MPAFYRYLGGVSFLIGVFYYSYLRETPPLIIQELNIHTTCVFSTGEYYFMSIPSFLHAFAFTCLLCSLWKITKRRLLLIGLLWFIINVIWEMKDYFFKNRNDFSSTYDSMDICFSAFGAFLPFFLYILKTKNLIYEKSNN